jgi:hypothetical protein
MIMYQIKLVYNRPEKVKKELVKEEEKEENNIRLF